MIRYCKYCKETHDENDLCERYKKQLKENPQWLNEALSFSTVASQYHLVTSQTLEHVANGVNELIGTNLHFEGSHQFARDVQVFAKLNSDSFSKSSAFSNAETAKQWFLEHPDSKYLKCRLNGTGQEVDWLRQQQGSLKSIFQKSVLPDGNTVGYDGETLNRFTGETIEKVSIKAASTTYGIKTNVNDIITALEKGTLSPNDSVLGIEGTKNVFEKAIDESIEKAAANGDKKLLETLQKAKSELKITESKNLDDIEKSTQRLKSKIAGNKANPYVTPSDVANQMAQGAIIGAAVEFSVATITNYIRYKNGEITREDAFREVGEASVRGAIVGGTMAGITLFLPAGPVGWVAGMAIGIYLRTTVTNVLDEIFGKGAYEQILDSCGYIKGTAQNLGSVLDKMAQNARIMNQNHQRTSLTINNIQLRNEDISNKLDELDSIMKEF